MTRRGYVFAILIALALVTNIPYVAMAQNSESNQVPAVQNMPSGPPPPDNQSQPGGQSGQTPQPKGGIATVIGVDQPDNCLRIRSGPGNDYDAIGCANMGDQLNITGVWTSNDWAQLADNGWVYGPQISTDLRPPRTAYSRRPSYVVGEEVVPDYDDWGYLPDYGYDSYWYGGVPIFFYNVAIWNWYHPWWWWHGLQAWWWQGGFHGRRHWDAKSFRNFARTRGVHVTNAAHANISALNRMGRTTRGASIASSSLSKFNVNRSNLGAFNANRFNANRTNIRSSNVNRFNTNRFNTNRFNTSRFRTGANARSRTFSNSSRFRSGSANAFRSRSFSTPRSFRSGNIGGRQFGGVARSGGFSPRFGGGGVRFGGGGRMGGGGGRRR